MAEVRTPPPVLVNPAIGAGGRLPRWVLVRRYALALAVVLLLSLAKILIAQRAISVVSVTPPDRVMASGLLTGAAPTDTDLEELAADLGVDGVVNLAEPSVAEQVTAASLHQAYLYLAVAPGAAPTRAQLRYLAGFVRRHTERGASVYLHDDVGGPRAVTTAAMLLLLRGQTWATVSAEVTPAELRLLGEHQRLALERLRSALDQAARSPAGHPTPRPARATVIRHTPRSGRMTPQTEATEASQDAATAKPGRPLTVAMATRRHPTEIGGVERVVAGVVRELARARPGWRVDIISAFRAGSRIEGMDGLSDILAAFRLGWKLRGSTADVIFVHCPECLLGIRLLRRRRGAPPLIAVWHGAGPVPYLRLRRPGHPLARALAWLRTFGERCALAADGHVAVHGQVEDCLRSLYGLSAPVSVIDNSLDVTIQDHLARPARGRVQTARTGLTALWVGQTGYRKGLDVAMAAVAQARADLPGLRLRVAGIPAGKATDGVDWLGVIPPDGMAEVYRDADLFIFPTRYESFGLVVIEAMAAGLPVIVSDVISAGIVTDGRNGVVVAGHHPSHYADALRHLAPPATRAVIAEANTEDVRRFNVESTVSGYAAVIESFAAIQ